MFCLAALSLSTVALAHSSHSQHATTQIDSDAFQPSSTVRVEQCWVRLLPSNLPSAGYFTIYNDADQSQQLLAASTTSFHHTMLHKSFEENGMAKMAMVDSIDLPAKSVTAFKPGGLHIMYEQPTGTVQVGDEMQVTFFLSHSQKVTASCKVNAAKAREY